MTRPAPLALALDGGQFARGRLEHIHVVAVEPETQRRASADMPDINKLQFLDAGDLADTLPPDIGYLAHFIRPIFIEW